MLPRRLRFLQGFLALTLSAVAVHVAGCATDEAPEGVSNDGDNDDDDDDVDSTSSAASAAAATTRLSFEGACRRGRQITIAAVGDVLLHEGPQRQGLTAPDGFRSLWKHVEPYLSRADLTYANFEGPSAEGVVASGAEVRDPGRVFDDRVYTSYPMFNYHPALIDDMLASGFDVVSTANNHSLDRRTRGADRTIANMKRSGMPFTGTRPSNDSSHPWYTITEARGVRVAWLACTFSTNGIPDRDRQVLKCYEDRATVMANIRALAESRSVDAVVVTPHWGDVEYTHVPATKERTLAREMLNAGAVAVLGAHPHVVQPWERYVTTDGREGFIMYSLGNFVSGQRTLNRRSSLILYLGLTKGNDGRVTVNGVRHLPIEMRKAPWTARLATGEPAALTTRILGSWNQIGPEESLVTNPECR